MPLRLVNRGDAGLPIELEGFVPSAARGLTAAEIERWTMFHGNRQAPLGEIFAVSGSAADGELRFEGDLSQTNWIGAGMDGGVIRIEGDAGRHIGSRMTGGEIRVAGSAGDFAGAEMQGGSLRIAGSAGDLAGGAYPGSRRGMRGGAILIGGDAGQELGRAMRRGLIAVTGATGVAPGYDMIAGTIVIGGKTGDYAGARMRRGTIVALDATRPHLLATFRFACRREPEILRLVLGELDRLGFRTPAAAKSPRDFLGPFDCFNGDLLTVGKGEILVRA